ncbi:MAG TPA: monovalent cation:proton antiporter-2 (CPA2) family protein [Edaphocola sp.]|nr:monovalent cation:proton antiporter-2 (CPA2) family protein [Edaphocola sp.]
MNENSIAITTLTFLGAAIIMVPLVKRFGLSSVIGYILGGIIIGPFVLKLTGSGAEGVMQATEFGVVMLLFLVGLEMEPKKFWSMRKQIFGLGITQLGLTVLIIASILILFKWETDVALAAAMCFAMSSTAIVLQTLSERHMMHTTAGEASFATLLFQDISVIPILALLPIIAHSNITEENESKYLIQMLPEWMQSFSVVIGVILLILLGRFIFVPFLRYVSKSGMSELLTASSLFLVIGVSELMTEVGLSPALGAFIAGVMLANSEFRNELESNIEPFKGLLLAVFFVSVGAMMNFNVIAKDYIFIFSLVGLVLVVKFLVLILIGKIFKIAWTQNLFFAFALSQVGEFAFVLLSFSKRIFLMNQVLFSQLMAVTAITMCITPILLIIYDKFISPREVPNDVLDSEFDITSMNVKQKKIIIVGFGYFGSTVGRLLKANKIPATILDHDPERVKLLRSYGFKVFYGDATRWSILEAAGINEAKILVLCLDNPDENKGIIESVRKKKLNIKIFVRAKNRIDAESFLRSGIDNLYRETMGTAVNMAVDVLHEMGLRKYTARRMGKRFELIDEAALKKMAKETDLDNTSFTIKDSILREQALLAEDSRNFESYHLIEENEEVDYEDDEDDLLKEFIDSVK